MDHGEKPLANAYFLSPGFEENERKDVEACFLSGDSLLSILSI